MTYVTGRRFCQAQNETRRTIRVVPSPGLSSSRSRGPGLPTKVLRLHPSPVLTHRKRLMRDAKIAQIYAGANEIQRLAIAKTFLKGR